MDLESTIDEFQSTAAQIFQYCGVETSGLMHVDTLMDKFEPFMKTDKSEYNCLRSLLDPDLNNGEINTKQLAAALAKYSETKHRKADLDESFNLMCGQVPQDSDSGISTDGFQQVEELQQELRARRAAAAQLRAQLDALARHHEDALATLAAERDALRAHLHVLREENQSLRGARADCDEATERLRAADAELGDARRDGDALRRRERALTRRIDELEAERASLAEQLSQARAEAHRLNEAYSSRQRALLQQCEALRADGAALGARLRAQAERATQLLHEKTHLELELKDALSRSLGARSADVSLTEEQMLSALDSLNAETKFATEHLLSEESFMNALKDEHQGRSTNISLFDELRCSLGRRGSRDHTTLDAATQTRESEPNAFGDKDEFTCSTPDGDQPYVRRLETRLEKSEHYSSELQNTIELYERQLTAMQACVDEGNESNVLLRTVIDKLKDKLSVLELASESIKLKLESISCGGADIEVSSVGVQAEAACAGCAARAAAVPRPGGLVRRYLWDPLKSLFSVFAGLFLVSALVILYNVSNYHFAARRCVRAAPTVPWRWLNVQDLLDFVFRIEYIGDVPV